jgi:predicted AAA+ superfamily ATPase
MAENRTAPTLPRELNLDLERQNPWWHAKPLPVLPEFRRWPFAKLRERLDNPIAPIVVIRGPRQIGKTTLQLQLIFASLTGLSVAHFPERGTEPEVDYVLTIGERRIPVEVKYRRSIDSVRDTLGLRSFLEKAANNATFGLLISRQDEQPVADTRIITIPLPSLLIVR